MHTLYGGGLLSVLAVCALLWICLRWGGPQL